ncbi:2-alkenal reductase (NADP(+)-dependent)-like [Dorcoceras hygrometricum]|uniref:2-alkenal reductase (NADP(+)-dependent)-like n=1 Tax=Dorcoceras hygrometricum TaxID=472368 RepID=A0A2Z7CEU7_9LAMI|nr:2-alkenal reductase (NADP(+)-dependent)-like [Dorcoceras hygrometricum]
MSSGALTRAGISDDDVSLSVEEAGGSNRDVSISITEAVGTIIEAVDIIITSWSSSRKVEPVDGLCEDDNQQSQRPTTGQSAASISSPDQPVVGYSVLQTSRQEDPDAGKAGEV